METLNLVDEQGKKFSEITLADNEMTVLIQEGFKKVLTEQLFKNRMGILKVVFNNPMTIVWFDDGTKVAVKVSKDDTFSEEVGVAMAVIKKYFNGRSNFKKFLEQWSHQTDDELMDEYLAYDKYHQKED